MWKSWHLIDRQQKQNYSDVTKLELKLKVFLQKYSRNHYNSFRCIKKAQELLEMHFNTV